MNMNEQDNLILAIESSCDETAASVIKNGRSILSNVVYSQIRLHVPYGGVVPEIASRSHIEKVDLVTQQAMAELIRMKFSFRQSQRTRKREFMRLWCQGCRRA